LNDDVDIDDNTDVIYAGGEGIQPRPLLPSPLLLSLPPTSSNFENDHLLDDDEDEDGSDDEPPPPCQLHDDILVGDDGRNDDQ
jgi:hypothetical protein